MDFKDFDPELNPFVEVDPFTKEDMTAEVKVPHRFSASALNAAQDKVMTHKIGCPAPLRFGPEDRNNKALGSGLLITNGREYGILTAAHVIQEHLSDNERLRDVWGMIASTPPLRGQAQVTVPGEEKVNLSERTPCNGFHILGGITRLRDDPRDRCDIGMIHISTAVGDRACAELGVKPLWIEDESRIIKGSPLERRVHVIVGTPASCQQIGGDNRPTLIAYEAAACRTYKSGNFSHIAYGVHPKSKRSQLDWHGFSGAPIWSVEPASHAVEKTQMKNTRCSMDDFQDPVLTGMLWASPTQTDLEDFQVELYAHQADRAFLDTAADLLGSLAILSQQKGLHGKFKIGQIRRIQ